MFKKAKIVFLIAGIIILLLLIRSFGLFVLIGHLKEIGWKFFWIPAIHLIGNIAFTYAWRLFINMPISFKQFGKMILARLAGDSTSSINALGAVAGEPIKAIYIKDFVPLNIGLASVILDRTIHNTSNILIILTGIFISFFILDLPMYIYAICFLAVIALLIIFFFILKTQQTGFIEYFINKLPSKITNRFISQKNREKIRAIDDNIKTILNNKNRKVIYLSMIIHYITTLVIASLELYLIVIFVDINTSFTFLHAVFVYIFGFIISSAIFFMPANIGISEGSYSVALKMLGFDPAIGVSMGIIRRIRAFVLAGIGVLLLFHAGILKKENR